MSNETHTPEQIADLHDNLQIERAQALHVYQALENLKAAARYAVAASVTEIDDALQTLEEAIPCDDCVCTPCRCPDE